MLSTLVLAIAFGTVAADLPDVLETAFLMEAQLLEAESDRYFEAREREQQALDRLERLTDELDRALLDPATSLLQLRDLEADLADARATAFARTAASAERRERLYVKLERIDQLGDAVENERDRSRVHTEDVGGVWQMEFSPSGIIALVTTERKGVIVIGQYRASDGSRGTLKGTVAGTRLRLDRIDAVSGFATTLEGDLDPKTGEIRGQWLPTQLGMGGPGGGTWFARKLSHEEAEEAAEQLPE